MTKAAKSVKNLDEAMTTSARMTMRERATPLMRSEAQPRPWPTSKLGNDQMTKAAESVTTFR